MGYYIRTKEGIKKLILCAAAAPSLIKRSYFPYGIDKNVVEGIIRSTYIDRPKMLKNFGKIFFHKISPFYQQINHGGVR